MSLFKTFRGNKSNLPQAINDGAIYALQDVEELYIDISENKRIKISDIIEIENKEALPLAPLENKFYYNVPMNNEIALDLNEKSDNDTLENPLNWYNYNNVNNKFVVSEINADYLTSGITIARNSKL